MSELLPWSSRQREEALLFNPAFLATLLAAAAADHERVARDSDGIRWTLAFLVPALALFEDTRAELPANTNARLLNWINDHTVVRLQLPERARTLAPLVREGARFGMRARALTFAGDRLRSSLDAATLSAGASVEAKACIERSAFLGRWFASVVDVGSVYALFGIEP